MARELAIGGAAEGTTVLADRQSGGRGRLGRSWFSPPGVNVYGSIVLRPAIAAPRVPQLTLVLGVAVADAVRAVTGIECGLKWPNDVIVDGRKAAGILTEMEAEGENVRHVIAGIGVNVNVAGFPPDLAPTATSLRLAAGRTIDRPAFTAALLVAVERRYERFVADGFAPVRQEWERIAWLRGKDIRVLSPEGEVHGRVLGVDDDGALRLATPSGIRRVVAGEVTVPGAYAT